MLLLLQFALLLAMLVPAQAMMQHAQQHTSSTNMDTIGMSPSDASGLSECAGHHHHAMAASAHPQHCSAPHHAHGPDCCMVGGCVQFSLTTDLWISAVHGNGLLTEADYHSSAFGLPAGETAMPALPPPRTLS
ncbi:hypothetical protein [Acetobacter aceti]|uniref:hypothetical protein n=1 Tax=Acetobacter aceti TaxID=435 RepID=UPI0011AEE088|nr:hypothetical protein [Acetobacter aceti]